MVGLDPYEERLLIAMLGGGVALIFAIALGIICCRKYRLDRSGGGGGAGKNRMWAVQQQRQLMFQRQPGMQQAYLPTGHQTNVNMDPVYLDPARGINLAGGPPPPQHPQVQSNLNPTYASAVPQGTFQQQPPSMRQADNTAYASMPYGRPSYSSHQV
ncbi:hypothetical protein BOX15_Mlig034111g2 [Macrostomum lignano]|uniref:Uncharacterized protein n=1 Tax=Macrostomum lignano TaxID=282301 RepID=A0A267FIX9_9PLAT|nr:hypothetical protein BOX15_Mlig034111g1 [Macrostomum lignano]PAA78246.1 hypothetical protein BOX15_Mlig034111g2 [Macrostomum lignano]